MLDHSPESAQAALRGLYGWAEHELIEVSIKSPRGKWKTQQWRPSVLFEPETLKQLSYWSGEGREIYMGCVGLVAKPDKTWRRGGAALRGHAGALWLDVDCQAPGREGEEFFTGIAQAVEQVDAALGTELAAASLVVGSGWGVQYWIPLREPVPGADASRLVRVLVGFVGEATGKKIDRVWDVTRVMRMPGTLNWRAGSDPDTAQWTGILRWPDRAYAGADRLGPTNVTALVARQVAAVLDAEVSDVSPVEGPVDDVVDALLARFFDGAGAAAADDEGGTGGGWADVGHTLGDLERIADETLQWRDVLEPHGWRCVSGLDPADQAHEQVWERPGKPEASFGATGERSAVVYTDRPELLVVYSDSPLCGFAAGLRGSGRRGDGAGVGVISRWRAWVDLEWGGDSAAAAAAVRDGGADADGVAERLGRAWEHEMGEVMEWIAELEWAALMNPHLAYPEHDQ
jgi:hypothetical protein